MNPSVIKHLTIVKSPFNLKHHSLYQRWRDWKLKNYPTSFDELSIKIKDPRRLSPQEYEAILQRCQKTNMAIYISDSHDDPDRRIPHDLAKQFGLNKLNYNWLGDKDGLTSVSHVKDEKKRRFIPYSDLAIQWHTDGYYNAENKQIYGMLLHCVRSAIWGGENALLDPEIAYILLREQNPNYIRALMAKDVMTIPARLKDNRIVRKQEIGPVFSISPKTGNLHMRYTVRKQHIIWKKDRFTREALEALTALLKGHSTYIFRGRLEPGMGLISNNVLHNRSRFKDTASYSRLLYRARYFDRIADTDVTLLS